MVKQSFKVNFNFLAKTTLPDRNALKLFVQNTFKIEKIALEMLTYIFCSDNYLHSLNTTYLKHDTYTDIITFCLSEKDQPIVGDVYISIDRIKENANFFKTSYKAEIHRVIFHGALHLCNYNDKTEAEAKLMRSKENFYLHKYFVSRETF